jgi:hypothetical protein
VSVEPSGWLDGRGIAAGCREDEGEDVRVPTVMNHVKLNDNAGRH